jgi:hypothetical protein
MARYKKTENRLRVGRINIEKARDGFRRYASDPERKRIAYLKRSSRLTDIKKLLEV